MKKRYPHKKKVLLVNITRLGDMLQATPTIAGLKAENPGCHITVLVEKQFVDVCHVIPNIDEAIGIDLGFVCRSLDREGDGIVDAYEYLHEIVERLRSEKFDYCLNMSSSAYTALLLNLVGIGRNGGWTSDEQGYRVIESQWAQLFATSVFHQNRQYNSLNLVDVFRCSADVDAHPHKLLINIEQDSIAHCEGLIKAAPFSNTGPLIAVQAGASQAKRQWSPKRFVEMIKILVRDHNARVVLTGAPKEACIVDPIVAGCASNNVLSVVGKTTVPQLAAMLKMSAILVTGDTGPMHMAVAVGTPVISMFLASAYGFETGPYSEGNIVLQPVIGCGPCNPNKSCGRPDCHDTVSPEFVAYLTAERLKGDIKEVSPTVADPRQVIVYRSAFDEHGFCDLVPLNTDRPDAMNRYRRAYRKLWLEDLGGFHVPEPKPQGRLPVVDEGLRGLEEIVQCAKAGQELIRRLEVCIKNPSIPPSELGDVSQRLTTVDSEIEGLGFKHGPLESLSRMFIFAKENLKGTDPLDLASQMNRAYQDLERRCVRFGSFYLGE